jgi:hypothetical protein
MKSFLQIAQDNFITSGIITTFNTAAGYTIGYLSTTGLDSSNEYMSGMTTLITPIYTLSGFGTGLKYSIISSIAHHLVPEDHLLATIAGNLIVDLGIGLYNKNLDTTGILLVTDAVDLALELGINHYLLS